MTSEPVKLRNYLPDHAGPLDGATPRIVLIGASGHARVILDILELAGEFRVAGLLDNFKPCGRSIGNYDIIGVPGDAPRLLAQGLVSGAIVGVGDNWTRARITAEIRNLAPHFDFVTAIHPSAVVARDARLGAGTVVMAGAVINPGCEVGEGCIVNTRASLDHDSVMGDFSSLGPGVTTGGRVRIGAYSAIGIGATILQDIAIGAHTVVGASATVFHDLSEFVVAYGTPARIVRARQAGDRYLIDRRAQAAGAR